MAENIKKFFSPLEVNASVFVVIVSDIGVLQRIHESSRPNDLQHHLCKSRAGEYDLYTISLVNSNKAMRRKTSIPCLHKAVNPYGRGVFLNDNALIT